MKKLFFLFALVVGLAATSYAQQATRVTVDTLTNADTADIVINSTAGYTSLAIQTISTKVSGTTAGTVIVYKSLDGTNWVAAGDTLTLSNVSTPQVLFAEYAAPAATKYRVRFLSVSGAVTRHSLYYVQKR